MVIVEMFSMVDDYPQPIYLIRANIVFGDVNYGKN